MYINILAFALHIPISYYLAITLNLQIVGLGIATSVHFLIRYCLMRLAIRLSRFNSSLVALNDPDTFWNFKTQFKFSAQNSMMFVASQWALDSFTLMSTFMAVNVIAAQTVCRSIILLLYMVAVGLAQAS